MAVTSKRFLIKLSGEALMGSQGFGIDPAVIKQFAKDIDVGLKLGHQIAVVIGGGNLFRGAKLSQAGLDRVSADHMGMLATLMNALAMRDIFEQSGMVCRIMSAIPMSGIVDHHDRRKASEFIAQGKVVIFAAGTGNPLVTSDSAASLRGIEIKADMILKGTNVDGIYDQDPALHPQAKLLKALSFKTVLKNQYKVMDLAAFCQCSDHDIPIRVFNVNKSGALAGIMRGEPIGTLVHHNA